ncbi:MAG: sulfatase [Phycisphaerae bacterium]|jgi:arylsulfatase A-like enzyme
MPILCASRRRPARAAIFVLAAALPAGCTSGPPPRSEDPRPNVILVTLDTVRADHLSAYGYSRRTSPNLDAFALGATRYEQAMATAPWTVPSHASLFTGKMPFEHGAHSFEVASARENNVSPLRAEETALAEALQQEGYATGAFVSNIGYLSPWTQLDQGFATYTVEWGYAQRLNRDIRPWLERNRNQPFFLFINYMDAHRPYNASPRPGFLDPPAVQDQGQLLDRLIEHVLPGAAPPPPELVQQVIDQYDTAIANLDEQLGVLLGWLRELNVFDNSLIIITSDHGEYFGEHNLVEHSKDVYQPAIRVPLLVKRPRQTEGAVEAELISLARVPGLVMDCMPPAIAQRRRALFDGAASAPVMAENSYSRTKDLFDPRWGARFNRVRTAIYDWPLKFIRSSDGRDELYNLLEDPGELRNLAASHASDAARLRERLERFEAGRTRAPAGGVRAAELSDEQRRILRSLGYVGGDDGE